MVMMKGTPPSYLPERAAGAIKDCFFILRSGQPSLLKVRVPSLFLMRKNLEGSFFWERTPSPRQSPVLLDAGNVIWVSVSAICSLGHLMSLWAILTLISMFTAAPPLNVASMVMMKGTPPSYLPERAAGAIKDCFFILRSGQPSLLKVRVPSLFLMRKNLEGSFCWERTPSPRQSPVLPDA